jgi:general stress protein 26
MERDILRSKILEVIKGHQLASLATVTEDGKPWVRYVMTLGTEDLMLFVVTSARSRKVIQVRANPNIHVTVGGSAEHMDHPYLNIIATARVLDDAGTKKKFWHDELKQYFSGPDDPDYIIFEIRPSVIEYMGLGSMEPLIYRL